MAKNNPKLTGRFYDFEGEEGYEEDVRQAIVTKERIAMDWDEDGELFLATLHSEDGYFYEGTFGSPRPEPSTRMSGYLYKSVSGEYLFWAEWNRSDTGFGGANIIFLSPYGDEEE